MKSKNFKDLTVIFAVFYYSKSINNIFFKWTSKALSNLHITNKNCNIFKSEATGLPLIRNVDSTENNRQETKQLCMYLYL